MARLKNGILNGGSGKVGNVVMYTRNGQDFIRAKPNYSYDKKTPAQLAQRQKMALIHEFLRPAKELIQKTFANDAVTRSPYQAAQSYNLKHAIAGEYPNQYIDLNKGLISKGNILLPEDISYSADDNGITINWNPDSTQDRSVYSDSLILAWKYKNESFIDYMQMGVRREIGTFLWNEITFKNINDYTIWLFFRNREETDYSDSYCLHVTEK